MKIKEATLYPVYMTKGTALVNLLSADGTGEDYRTIGVEKLDVGTIAFDSSLESLSKACQLFTMTAELNFRHTSFWFPKGVTLNLHPREITSHYTNDNIITVNSYESLGDIRSFNTTSSTYSGIHYKIIDEGRPSGGIFGSNRLYALHMSTDRGSGVGSTELWLKNLRLNISYVANFYAKFYDGNGTIIEERVYESGQTPDAPSLPEKEGYFFAGWKNGSILYPKGTTLPQGDDRDLIFTAVYYKNPTIHGSITEGEGKSLKGDMTVEYGEPCTLYFNPAEDYYVKDVIVDGKSVGEISSYTFESTVNDHTVEVKYSRYCIIRINPVENGKLFYGLCLQNETPEKLTEAPVGGEVLRYKASDPFNQPDDQRLFFVLFAVPDKGYELSDCYRSYINYSSNTTGTSESGKILLMDYMESTYTAEFSKIVFNVTKNIVGKGTIEGPDSFEYGDDIQFSFNPEDHYAISDIIVDGNSVMDRAEFFSNRAFVDFENVTNDLNIIVRFKRMVYISWEKPENGNIKGNNAVDYEADAQIQITAEEGYSIDKIYIDGKLHHQATLVEQSRTLFFENLTEDVTIKATFTNNISTLTVNQPAGGGVIYGSAVGDYVSGSQINLQVYVNSGWYFANWYNGHTEDKLTFNITENTEVSVELIAYSYTIIAKGESNGKVEPAEISANTDDVVTFKAVPDAGYVFDQWEDGSTDVERQHTVKDNAELTAYFKKGWYDIVVSAEGGSVEIIKGVPNDDGKYEFDSEVELEAYPDEGYHFAMWSDEFPNAKRTIRVPAEGGHYIAQFEKCKYDVNVHIKSGEGFVTESKTVKYGDELKVEATNAIGYKLSDIVLDGKSIYDSITLNQKGGYYLLSNIKEPHNVEVYFKECRYHFGRQLIDYYPPVIQRILEFIELTDAQQPLVGRLWDAVSFAYDNQFIDDATDEGLKGWEKDYDITPLKTDTMTARRQRLKAMWVPSPRYTYEWLVRWLQVACDDESIIPPEVVDYTIRPYIPIKADYKTIIKDLRKYAPSNMLIKPIMRFEPLVHNHYTGIALRVKIKNTIENNKHKWEANE